MRLRLALFDFDGTLADSADWFLKRVNEAADELNFRRVDPEDFERLRGFSSQEVMAYLGIPKWKLPMLMARMRKSAARDQGEIRLFPGVEEMFQDLRAAGIQSGIVSSNSEPNIRKTLGSSIGEYISVWACGASLFGKAAKLRGVLRRTRIKPADAIYIGDEIRDAVASHEVGMQFGAVAWGFTTLEALQRERPDFQFSRMEEIAAELGKLVKS